MSQVRSVTHVSGPGSLLVAIPAGLEPATRGVEIRYSIQLSYGTVIQLSYGTVGARPEPANAPFIALSI